MSKIGPRMLQYGKLLLGIFGGFAQPALAGSTSAHLEEAAIVGLHEGLTATSIPVPIAGGGIVYWDMTVLLATDGRGSLALAPGYPKFQPVPVFLAGFRAGDYGPVTVTGPGVGSPGATIWSLATNKRANACTVPVSALWDVGPIADNPLAARIEKDGIISADYAYGLVGAGPAADCAPSTRPAFGQGALIGVWQAESSLTIVSFTSNGTDYKTPIAQITYNLLPQ
jgi:hypothetical protein